MIETRSPDRLVLLRAMPYDEYLQTPEWRRTRDAALRRADFRCQLPGCGSKANLQVHHREYARLGEEVPEDLTVLCGACHNQWHHGIMPGRPQDPLAVYVALAYRTVRDAESISEWVAAVKTTCGRLRIPYGDHQVDQAVDRVLRALKKTVDFGDVAVVPLIPRELLPPVERSLSHSEAVEFLNTIVAQHRIRCMAAVRQLSDLEILQRRFLADQRLAYRLVQQEILETARRVAALEDAIEAADQDGSR
jgi:hypothetical protein